jgi:hypothetical protein
MPDIILRVVVLVTAVAQIVFPFFVNPFRGGTQPVRAFEPSQIEPARYAFSIWGPIYLGALVYAIWQLTPAGRSNPATLRMAPLAIALYLGSSFWLSAARFGPLWATIPILAAMAACAVTCLILGERTADGSLQQFVCLLVPFALYAGWTVCATFVNLAEVAPRYGFNRFGLTVPDYAVLSIAVLTVVVAGLLWLTKGNLVLAGTVAWALVAIIAAAYERSHSPKVVLSSGIALALVLALTFTLRSGGNICPR